MNISGVLVKTHPENISAVKQALTHMSGVEVHGNNEDGRIVITVEDTSASNITDTVSEIQEVRGVLSAAMIYHQLE